MRRAARVDDNQGQIVDALRRVGCSVWSLAGVGKGFPDLAVVESVEDALKIVGVM